MTVGELIQLLQEHEPEREVFATLEVDHDLYDAPVEAVVMRGGSIYVEAAEA